MSSFLAAAGWMEMGWVAFVMVGTLAVFVAGIRVLRRVADRHRADDARAGLKATLATLVGLVLAGGGALGLDRFEAGAQEGIHDTFVNDVNRTLGEGDYLAAKNTIATKPATVELLRGKLEAANASYASDPTEKGLANRVATWLALNSTQDSIVAAQVQARLLEPNHHVWLRVAPLLAAHDEAAAHEILLNVLDDGQVAAVLGDRVACGKDPKTGNCLVAADGTTTPKALQHSYRDTHTLLDVPMDEGVEAAFHGLEEFSHQMQSQLRWFAYPMVTGFLMAPFAFAGGSILKKAFRPSETIGFKPYPGAAAGWFLLTGAFGLFAVVFSAWVLRDLSKRSVEGQISL